MFDRTIILKESKIKEAAELMHRARNVLDLVEDASPHQMRAQDYLCRAILSLADAGFKDAIRKKARRKEA